MITNNKKWSNNINKNNKKMKMMNKCKTNKRKNKFKSNKFNNKSKN